MAGASDHRRAALEIYEAALAAADPAAAVARTIVRRGSSLSIASESYDLAALGGVRLLALGKAAAAMTRGAARALGDAILGGMVVTSRGSVIGELPVPFIESGHPIPDESSVAGARALISQARAASALGNLTLVLLSGGASALVELPAPPLTLEDSRATTDLLLRSGATIQEMNVVRKHLSAIKGGQLALAAAPSPVVTLVLSDVVGSPLDAIGSGPTVPDASTWGDAAAILKEHGIYGRIPQAARDHLERGLRRELPDTPKAGHPALNGQVLIVGNAALSAEAARVAAERAGFHAEVVNSMVEGDAETFAQSLPAFIDDLRDEGHPVHRPACLVFAGETTVVVRGNGRGGRNQQLALAFAAAVDGVPGVSLAALATDGIDGPGDAAGAVVDGTSAAQLRTAGVDCDRSLKENDAGAALDAIGALIRRGPSGTNVNDLILLFVE